MVEHEAPSFETDKFDYAFACMMITRAEIVNDFKQRLADRFTRNITKRTLNVMNENVRGVYGDLSKSTPHTPEEHYRLYSGNLALLGRVYDLVIKI